MTALCAHQLQVAVFEALAADTALSARLTGVYDEPPAEARYPFLAFGETNVRENGLKDRDGVTINFDVFLWSAEASQMEVKELMALADKVLHSAGLLVQGHDLITLKMISAGVIRQFNEQGSLYRGRLSYSALLYDR